MNEDGNCPCGHTNIRPCFYCEPLRDQPAVLEEALKLRGMGVYTMREIAEKLGVNREELLAALEAQRE